MGAATDWFYSRAGDPYSIIGYGGSHSFHVRSLACARDQSSVIYLH